MAGNFKRRLKVFSCPNPAKDTRTEHLEISPRVRLIGATFGLPRFEAAATNPDTVIFLVASKTLSTFPPSY